MEPAGFFRFKLGVSGLFVATGTVAAAVSIGGLAGQLWWLLDLASHFRVQYFVVLAIVAIVQLILRAYRLAILFAVVGVYNLALILPLYAGASGTDSISGPALRAMLINVHTGNTDHASVLNGINSYDPDFVIVEEVNHRWMGVLQELGGQYPHVVSRPREDNFGIALLSKHRIVDSEVVDLGDIGVPSILARFDVQGSRFVLMGTHAVPPVSAEHARWRNDHLAAIPEVIRGVGDPIVLLGDLNVSPWSFHFKRLIRESGLSDASQGRGIQPTWPTHMLPLLIPIDHCLHSRGIEILNKAIGADVGSDHYPVMAEFAIS